MTIRDFSLAGIVFRAELRSATRDRHTLIYSLVLPFFLYPALIWFMFQGMQYREGALEKQVSRIAWEGEENLPVLFERILADERFEPVETDDPRTAVIEGELDVFLSVRPAEEGETEIEALLDLSRDRSLTTRDRLAGLWDPLRDEMLRERLAASGGTPATVEVINLREENVASAEEMGRFLLSLILPLTLVLMLSMGAMYPAIDVLVGEKERGTLEGLLAAGTPRASIVAGKFLAVLTAAICALVANLASMLIAMKHLTGLLSSGGKSFAIAIPWGSIPVILLGGILLGAFYGASMILISSFARTFKEGQGYLSPFFLICMVPAIAGTVPTVEFGPLTALIPLTNVTLLFRSALVGSFPPLPVAIVFLSLGAYLVLVLGLAQRVLGREDFFLGSPVRRRRFRLAFFSRGGSS